MLKFIGDYEEEWIYPEKRQKKVHDQQEKQYSPFRFPTVEELDEFNAVPRNLTIKQVLSGQAVIWNLYQKEYEPETPKNRTDWERHNRIELERLEREEIKRKLKFQRDEEKRIRKENREKLEKEREKEVRKRRLNKIIRARIHKPSQRVVDGMAYLFGITRAQALGRILQSTIETKQYLMVKEHVSHICIEEENTNG